MAMAIVILVLVLGAYLLFFGIYLMFAAIPRGASWDTTWQDFVATIHSPKFWKGVLSFFSSFLVIGFSLLLAGWLFA